METVIRNVRDLDQNERAVLERVVGHQLRETQQVTVNVVNLQLGAERDETPVADHTKSPDSLPEWCNIYEGLSDAEVDELSGAIVRCHLSRSFE